MSKCKECDYWGGTCRKHRPIREPQDQVGIEHDMITFGEAYVVFRKPPLRTEDITA
jgi:hypothetical protein